jgi:hypothetical protein
VTADPVPHDPIFLLDGQCAIFQTDTYREDVIFAIQLFELLAGVCRITLEETICAFGILLRFEG